MDELEKRKTEAVPVLEPPPSSLLEVSERSSRHQEGGIVQLAAHRLPASSRYCSVVSTMCGERVTKDLVADSELSGWIGHNGPTIREILAYYGFLFAR